MLNELCQLADALEKNHIQPKEWHPQLKSLPNVSLKKPCYRICIAEDGVIVSIEPFTQELVVVLRKWEPNNGNSFPGFNIQPLYRITDEDAKNRIKSWREDGDKKSIDIELLKSWCVEGSNNWDRKIEAKLTKCLGDIPKELEGRFDSNNTPASISIRKLIKRVSKYSYINEDSNKCDNDFRKILEKYLWETIEAGKQVGVLLPILIHEGSVQREPEEDHGSVSVFLDIPDWKEFPVAHQETISWINDQLVNQVEQREMTNDNNHDAFGDSLEGGDDTLPVVKLPFVGKVGLRSMNHESGCQYRYGTIDAKSFPFGQKSRKRAKGAIEWLGDECREGETWGRADIKELIFAYPVQLPSVSLKLAACFGAKKNNDSEARFANAAKDVIDGLKAAAKDLNGIEIRVFSLKKMDTTSAKTKVVFYRNYTAQRLVDATRDWEEGCANIPNISIRAWGDQKGQWENAELMTPFPLQIAQCLNRIWKQDGTTECEASIVACSDGINLLLDEQPARFVPHLLSVVLQNAKGLFSALGNVLHRGEVVSVKGYDKQRLLMPSILGLLLYKLGIRKEKYMNNAPFLVGKMLKLADELHALYCKEVRDNHLPPQLVGNSMMTAALESPVQALAQLALRLKPYYGWAQTFKKGREGGGLCGYFVGLYGEVAAQLAAQELPLRLNDAERAQLLLGYLASNSKKDQV